MQVGKQNKPNKHLKKLLWKNDNLINKATMCQMNNTQFTHQGIKMQKENSLIKKWRRHMIYYQLAFKSILTQGKYIQAQGAFTSDVRFLGKYVSDFTKQADVVKHLIRVGRQVKNA